MKIMPPPPTSTYKCILYSAYGGYIQYVCIGGYAMCVYWWSTTTQDPSSLLN